MLSLLLDHQSTGCYAWGVAVVADVYRQLGMASRALGNGISGCALLVRVWNFIEFNKVSYLEL